MREVPPFVKFGHICWLPDQCAIRTLGYSYISTKVSLVNIYLQGKLIVTSHKLRMCALSRARCLVS